jgi:basic membrane lipoprotein Med (substrate-binding protein (PBP1-ABC) superfamily)
MVQKAGLIAAAVIVIVIIAAAVVYLASQPALTPTPTPTKIKMAVVYVTPVEEPWNSALHTAMTKAVSELGIEYDYQESVSVADVERVLRDYVQRGYDLIWAHSYGFGDAARKVGRDFPNAKILHGSGLETTSNVGIYDYWIHEATYLEGVIAGLMTKTNKIGIVAGYPVPDVDILLNAFIKGAIDINPNVKVMVTFIESWYDPPKAMEAAKAQMDAGADVLFAERHGVISAAAERGVWVFGNIVDQTQEAPKVVLTSAVWDLYPFVEEMTMLIKEGKWKADNYAWGMAKGCSKLAPLNPAIPKDIQDKIEDLRKKIVAGELKVLVNPNDPKEVWPGVVL